MLLDAITKNRRRVQTILKSLADVQCAEGLSLTLKELAREELLSEEQHLKLGKALLEEELNTSRLVAVIKDTKIGQGLKFQPRLKGRNLGERGYLMDRQRDLEETFEPVATE